VKKIQEIPIINVNTNQAILYIAFELNKSPWKLAFSGGNKVRYVTNDVIKFFSSSN
jgi:hypothetical protein